jgi:hypothetical protein
MVCSVVVVGVVLTTQGTHLVLVARGAGATAACATHLTLPLARLIQEAVVVVDLVENLLVGRDQLVDLG